MSVKQDCILKICKSAAYTRFGLWSSLHYAACKNWKAQFYNCKCWTSKVKSQSRYTCY